MFDATKSITILAHGAGDALDVLGAPMIVKSESGGFLADHIVPPGYVVPPHMHEHDEEIFYMLEGRLTLMDGESESTIGPGEAAKFERGVVHGFRNDTSEAVRFLVICTPGVQAAEMFRHLDRAGRAAALTPQAVGEICAQYGVHMRG